MTILETLSNHPAVQQAIGFAQENNLAQISPEIIIATTIVFALWSAMYRREDERQNTWLVALIGIIAALVCLALHFFNLFLPGIQVNEVPSIPVLGGIYVSDLFGLIIRTLLVLGTGLVLFMTRRFALDQLKVIPGEFYTLLLTGLLGGMFLTGAVDLILMFVGLETLGIASYIMAGYLRGNLRSAEASFKYLVYGGASSACLLFGFSLLYGLMGGQTTLSLHPLDVSGLTADSPFMVLLPVMAVLILAGVGFKLSAAPFHLWTPDVYEGSPTPVTAFLSVVSKAAGFAFAVRLLTVLIGPQSSWFAVLAILSVLSMTIGNFVALKQTNIKRLLAYSTIAHAGYILLGLLVFSEAGLSSLLFYLLTYLFMNLGAFAVVIFFGNLTGSDEIRAYSGLAKRQPFLAFCFVIFLLSLAGIPITAGFFAKFFLFQAVANAGTGNLWLIIVALLNSTVSLYYYLNVIRVMVIGEPSAEVKRLPAYASPVRSSLGVAMLVSLLGTLALGIVADPVLSVCGQSVRPLVVQHTASAKAPEGLLSCKRK